MNNIIICFILTIYALPAHAQTRVDIRAQAKNADLSQMNPTRPLQVGTALPVSCSTGDLFFKSSAPSGQNIYGCTNVNTWTLQSAGSQGGSASFQMAIGDLKPSYNASTLTIGTGYCWGINKPSAQATITAGSGNGNFVAYCTDTQTIVVEHSLTAGVTIQCTNCNTIALATPTVPEGMYKIASGAITAGAFSSVNDDRTFMTGHRHTNGAGMNTQCSAGTCVDQVDAAIVQLKTETYPILREFGYSFTGTLTAGKVAYLRVPFTCTIMAWSIQVDTGTATVDIWRVPNGSAVPTNSNSITASATPAISSGTAVRSTTLTGWNTAVAAGDIVGIALENVTAASFVNLNVECRQ